MAYRNKKDKTKYNKNYNREKRLVVLKKYGNKCVCCKERKKEFLSMDHIKGGGNKHREKIKINIYSWAIKNNFPKRLRILCHNCNMAHGMYGYCPHKK